MYDPRRHVVVNTNLLTYDETAEAIQTRLAYKTHLDPPPDPPTAAEGTFIPMAQWDTAHRPPHVHLLDRAMRVAR